MQRMTRRAFFIGGTAAALGGPAVALEDDGLEAALRGGFLETLEEFPEALNWTDADEAADDVTMASFAPPKSVRVPSSRTRVPSTPSITHRYQPKAGTGRIWLKNPRNGEKLDLTYRKNGALVRGAQAAINRFCRDWRDSTVINIDLRTIDIVADVQETLQMQEPILLLSGCRSAKTNALLRKRSKGVAENSLHLRGKALDLRFPGRTVTQAYQAGLTQHKGGIGRYSKSNFVHFDSGRIRTWGA